MKSIETPDANFVFKLEGGTDENDLHVRRGSHAGADGVLEEGDPCYHLPYIQSVWEPRPDERAAIATGANVQVTLVSRAQPPIALNVTRAGRVDAPPAQAPAMWLEISERTGHDLAEVLMLLARRLDPQTDPPALIGQVNRLSELQSRLATFLREIERHRVELEEKEASS